MTCLRNAGLTWRGGMLEGMQLSSEDVEENGLGEDGGRGRSGASGMRGG